MMYFDRTALHYTLQGGGTQQYSSDPVVFKVNVQPSSGQTALLVDGQYGKTFTGFTTYSGLRVNDAITISGTTTISGGRFKVKAVLPYNYGPLQHYEFVVSQAEV